MLQRTKFAFIGIALLFFLMAASYRHGFYFAGPPQRVAAYFNKPSATAALAATSPFAYLFQNDEVLEEAGSMEDSANPYWWVNSGGYMFSFSGIGETMQGELPMSSRWRIAYSMANPIDTDNGYHPQNIFRLISRSVWQNVRQTAYFWIQKDNLSLSPNRNESNGILLLSRYLDGDNLYYAGIRVDGSAVIKKKYQGVYYTLAQNPVYMGNYQRALRPNLLPHNTWIGLRSEVANHPGGGVSIKLYLDPDRTRKWLLVAEARDDGKSYGGRSIFGQGYAGIRTDFMDVQFDEWAAEKIDIDP